MNTKLFTSVEAGHAYLLQNHEDESMQELFFIKKQPVSDDPLETQMETVQQGTTNEAVISMLIDRMQVLDEKFPSEYNRAAIRHLHLAYEALVARTADREARGVEGTHQQ